MAGNKSVKRAINFSLPEKPYESFRVVSAPEVPEAPGIPLVDNLESVVAINEVLLWLLAGTGVTATVQLWAIDGANNWFFVEEVTLAVAGQSQVFHISGVPAAKYAAVVTAVAGGEVAVGIEHTA